MADSDFEKSAEDERFLVVSFDNEKPMTATQVASILRAMDQDYMAINGRHLVVARLELGSTWVWVTEQAVLAGSVIQQTAAVVQSIEALGTFAKRLITTLRPKADLTDLYDENAPDSSVDRTASAIAKGAMDTNSTAHIRKTVKTETKSGTRTEILDVKINPVQAKQVRTYIRNRPKFELEEAVPRLESGPEFMKLAGIMRALPSATGDLEALVKALVEAHVTHGTTSVLRSVADTLDAEGRSDIAVIIRRDIEDRPGPMRITEQ